MKPCQRCEMLTTLDICEWCLLELSGKRLHRSIRVQEHSVLRVTEIERFTSPQRNNERRHGRYYS